MGYRYRLKVVIAAAAVGATLLVGPNATRANSGAALQRASSSVLQASDLRASAPLAASSTIVLDGPPSFSGTRMSGTTYSWAQNVAHPSATTLLVVALTNTAPSASAGTLSVTDNGTPMTAVPLSLATNSTPNKTITQEMFYTFATSATNNLVASAPPATGAGIGCSSAYDGVLASNPVPRAGHANSYNITGSTNQIGVNDPNANGGELMVGAFAETIDTTTGNAARQAQQTPVCNGTKFGGGGTTSPYPNLLQYTDYQPEAKGSTLELWQGDSTQLPVLSVLVLNPATSPTASRVARFTVHREGGRTVFTWTAPRLSGVIGFNLFAGGHRINAQLIAAHRGSAYHFATRRVLRGAISLHIVLAGGKQQVVVLSPVSPA